MTETPIEFAVDEGYEGYEHAHKPDRFYVQIAIILAVLTGLEVTLSYVHIGPLTLPVLFVLMAVKFIMVALFFMHLRFDSTWFNAAFWSGLLFSLGVYIGALATFKFFLS